jgi:hypothetical protein
VSSPADGSFSSLTGRIRRAVEAVAASDPNPADPFRGLYISDDLALALARVDAPAHLDERLGLVARRLGLSELEHAVLGICATPEVDPRFGRLLAYLHDDVTRKLATPRLTSRLLASDDVAAADVLRCFDQAAPLRRLGALRLLEPGGPLPLAERPVKVADRLAALLLGSRIDDPWHDGRLRPHDLPAIDPGRSDAVATVRTHLRAGGDLPIVVAGADAAAVLAVALDRGLLRVDVADAGDAGLLREAAFSAALEGRELCFDGLESLAPADRHRCLRALDARPGRVLVLVGHVDAAVVLGERTAIVVDVPPPSFDERIAAWRSLAGTDDVGDVAAKFRLSLGQIAAAAAVARAAAAGRDDGQLQPADLDLGARQSSSGHLGELATRLAPAFRWSDLVLPDRQRETLASVSAYLRHRDLVLSGWGYDRAVAPSQGLKVLFAGESGTGKTMAARVLARELGLELFRIDLATMVSKYIGETEKNLDRVFDAAEGSNAILFFDEADALFGKRSEVRDAHDRYANIEVAYLLQKMESYSGAVILATNFRHNIDDAFLRRLDFAIDFPFPEAEDRRRIWALVLPATAPQDDDIDLDFLASQFRLSGGSIRNVSLAAAFLAASEDAAIGMRHLVRGVALEYGKLGRLTLESEFERFHELIRPQAEP